jgi:hypothetical protein
MLLTIINIQSRDTSNISSLTLSFSTVSGRVYETGRELEEKSEISANLKVGNQPRISKEVENAYAKLISSSIEHMGLKSKKLHPLKLSIPVGTDESNSTLSPIQVKKFCSDIRISADSKFNRNIVEILLLPISKSISLNEEVLYLSTLEDSNFSNYKNFVTNEDVQDACLNYVYSVLDTKHDDIITSQTTLRSFQEDTLVSNVFAKWKLQTIEQKDRHVLLAIYLSLVLFEVTHNNRSKRSKCRIVNYVIDRLAKSSKN